MTKAGWVVSGLAAMAVVVILAGGGGESGGADQPRAHTAPDANTVKTAIFLVSMAKGMAIACNLSDNGGFDAALAYLDTLPMAERQQYGEAMTTGVGGAAGAYMKDRNYPAVCATNQVRETISKADDARRFLLRAAGSR